MKRRPMSGRAALPWAWNGGLVTITSKRCASPAVTSCQWRSEEHTSELQSLMRISYAVFCLKHKKTQAKNELLRCPLLIQHTPSTYNLQQLHTYDDSSTH